MDSGAGDWTTLAMNLEAHEVAIAALTAIAPTVAAVAALVASIKTKAKVSEVHHATNSMKDALVASTDKLARLEGFAASVASVQEKPTQSQDAT